MAAEFWIWFDQHWQELSGICFLLLRTWLLKRENTWQRRLLEIELQRRISEQNETVRIMSTAYASEEPQTLEDLLSRAERDWSLRSSEIPSASRRPTPSGKD